MIVSIGSLNADFVVRTDQPPDGPGSLAARCLLRTSGGKGANVAVLATRLGAPTRLLGCVGDDDLADQALSGLRAAGVDLAQVRRRPGTTGYASVIVPPDGAKTILRVPGANDAWADDVESVRDVIAGLSGHAVVVVDLEVPATIVEAALTTARERGLTTVLDPAPTSRVDPSVLHLVDHLTPDHTEAAEMTGIDAGDVGGAVEAAVALRGEGPAVVHVKLADGGCAVATRDGVVVVDAPHVEPVDATGAGDAFAGGLAWALLEGRPAVEAARVAVAASTCAVTTYGSQESYPSHAALVEVLEHVTVRR